MRGQRLYLSDERGDLDVGAHVGGVARYEHTVGGWLGVDASSAA